MPPTYGPPREREPTLLCRHPLMGPHAATWICPVLSLDTWTRALRLLNYITPT